MTPADRERRFHYIRDGGCLCCRHCGWYTAPDIHHLNLDQHAGQLRRGDECTIGLCPWHHRGQAPCGMTERVVRRMLGPSMAKEPSRFREVFGSDDELLEEQNQLIARAECMRVGARVA